MIEWWETEASALKLSKQVAKFHRSASFDSKADSDRAFEQCFKFFRKTAEDLRKLSKAKDAINCKSATWGIFQRPYAQRAAALYAAYTSDRPEIYGPLNSAELKAWVKEIPKTHSLCEEVHSVNIPKSDGTFRQTFAFGRTRYAQQILFCWILSTLVSPFEADYMIAGRGGIHGSAETIAGLLSKGLRYWALADIKLAFPSINTLHLRAICRIDERLTRYIAFHRYALLCEDETEAKAPRARLPQGAAHASFVLSALMDRYLNSVELGDVDVVTYADNIAIGARTMEEATDALFALEKVLSNGLQGLPGGLTLHSHEIRDGFERSDFGAEPALHDKTKLPIRPSVDFVGYRIRWDVSDGKSHFSPSHAGWEKFWRKVSDAWESMPPCVSDETLEKVAYDRFLTWKKAFKLWATQDLAEELFLLNLQVRLNKFSDGKTAVCN